MARTRPHAPDVAPAHLSNIQILRGIAAALVLLYHVGNEIVDRGYAGDWSAFGAGSAGVDVFFVVSGFIVAHSARAAFGCRGAPGLFVARRAARLVPLYWLATAAAAMSLWWRHGLTPEREGWIAASFAFLFYPRRDGSDFPVCPQGWTLNFEALFYVAFAVALTGRRRTGLIGLAILFAALAALGRVVTPPWPLTRLVDTNTLEFVFGLGLAEAEARGLRFGRTQAIVSVAAGVATILGTLATVDDWLPYRGVVWGPPALAIVAAAALCRSRSGGRGRRALEALGNASYSLYLVQSAAIVSVGAGADRWFAGSELPSWLYGSACIAAALALALATHRLVERPATAYLERRLGLQQRWRAMVGPRDRWVP